jgi:glyoxylase-like metal-dependent hydrolase (beta-lactamase superfamily II)
MGTTSAFLDTDVRFGRATALIGDDGGKYPYGNSLLVVGPHGTVLIDPSLSLVGRGGVPAERVDRMLVSHAHEDHMAGIHLFPDAALHAHHEDLLGLHSLEGFMTVYGMPPEIEAAWKPEMVENFHYVERPDATGFADGDRYDLGGGVVVEVVHLAGHTRGHSGFLVDAEGVFFCADVDLTGFGPYYGDHWSNLEDFEAAIERCREIEARYYVTFHHKGVVEGRPTFLRMLTEFSAVIGRREEAMLAFLTEPRALQDLVAHRFVYRPGVQITFADHVEARTALQHLDRFARRGQVTATDDGRWIAT